MEGPFIERLSEAIAVEVRARSERGDIGLLDCWVDVDGDVGDVDVVRVASRLPEQSGSWSSARGEMGGEDSVGLLRGE